MLSSYIHIIVYLGALYTVDCLECYSCSGVSSVLDCITTTQCRTGQSCYTNSFTSGQDTKFTMGCTGNDQCGIQSGIVGRDLSERETDCHECCSTERCNNQLCVHYKPTTCMDDVKVDCAYLNAMFNICKDIQHSKNVCPKFCGLCTLVDGNWAEWSQWSACDVTCEKGLQTRKRTCTNPAPAHNGLDCVGNDTDTKICIKQPCPIHGGWTGWGTWGACSVTCDVGIQRRVRNCTNPYPSRFGDHCFGDPLEDKICIQGPCANGGWSSWGTWTSCSATCGGGLRSRDRSCTNPLPSLHGQYCAGPVTEVQDCNQQQCVVVFLAHGVTDTTPRSGQDLIFPTILFNEGGAYSSSTGKFTAPLNGSYSFSSNICHTSGENIYLRFMVEITEVVFLAHALTTYSVTNGERFVFTTNLVNVGGAYSNTTGYFTAPVNGSYSFSYQFCLYATSHSMYVNIMINNTYYSASHYYEANNYVCNASKIFVYLKKGDRVWVKCSSATSGTTLLEDSNHMNTFSGILIRT